MELDNRSDITEEGFEIIFKSCPQLKHLSLRLCRQVDDKILKLISKHEKNLRSIDLEGCVNITDNSLIYFVGLPLESVFISYCNRISDDGGVFLVNNFVNLKEINFDGIQWITEDFVEHLVNLQSQILETVILDGENMTDRSIDLLSKCNNLK